MALLFLLLFFGGFGLMFVPLLSRDYDMNFMPWFVTGIVCVVLSLIIGISQSVKEAEAFKKECEAKGGEVVVLYKQRDLCIKPESIIETE